MTFESFGERLKWAMDQAGLTQSALARKAGVKQQAISKIVRGEQSGTVDVIPIARAVSQNAEWLVEGIGDPIILGKTDGFTGSSIARVGEIDVEASAGPGQVVEHTGESHHWSFPEYWLRAMLDAAPADIKLITIKGDSGQSDPAKATDIDPGDKVFVNVADRRPSPPGLFVLWDGLAFVAKRVQMVPGTSPIRVRLSSNNPAYEPYEVSIEDAQIQGRIVARFQRIG